MNMGAARRNPKRNSSWVDKSFMQITREKSQKQTVPVRSLIMNFQSLVVQVQRAMRYYLKKFHVLLCFRITFDENMWLV